MVDQHWNSADQSWVFPCFFSNKRPLESSPTTVTPNANQAVTSGTPNDNNVLRMWANKSIKKKIVQKTLCNCNILYFVELVLWTTRKHNQLNVDIFCLINQPAAQNNINYKTLLGINIRPLGLNHDDLQNLTETLTQKPNVTALTENWIAEHEDAEEYSIEDYQPIFSNPRKNVERRSAGLAVYIRNGLIVKLLPPGTQIKCCLIKTTFTSSVSKLFCVIHWPEKLQLISFLPEF